MADFVAMARSARESLGQGLSALQHTPNVPQPLQDLEAPLAEAMRALFQIEKSAGAQIEPYGRLALSRLQFALAALQAHSPAETGVSPALAAVSAAWGPVEALASAAAGAPPSPVAANVPPPGSPRAWLPQAVASAAGVGAARSASAAKLAQLRFYADAALAGPPVPLSTRLPHARVALDVEADLLEVLRRCAATHMMDKAAERNRSAFAWLAGVFLAGSVIALFAMVAIGPAVAVPILVSGVTVGIAMLVLRARAGARDIEDRKLEVVSGLLARIGPELDLRRPVKVRADFRSVDQTRPVDGAASFRHGWLQMGFVLADGTRVDLDIVQTANRKKRSKRKYTKVKLRSAERLTVRLTAPRGKSFASPAAPRSPRSVMGLAVRGTVVQPRYAQFQFATAPTTRLYAGTWTASGLENELDARHVFAAVVASYRLAASAARGR